MTHVCISDLPNIGADRRQAIIWAITGILLTGTLGTNFSDFLIDIQTFSFNEIHLKMSSATWRPFCLGFNVLTNNNKTLQSEPHAYSLRCIISTLNCLYSDRADSRFAPSQ